VCHPANLVLYSTLLPLRPLRHQAASMLLCRLPMGIKTCCNIPQVQAMVSQMAIYQAPPGMQQMVMRPQQSPKCLLITCLVSNPLGHMPPAPMPPAPMPPAPMPLAPMPPAPMPPAPMPPAHMPPAPMPPAPMPPAPMPLAHMSLAPLVIGRTPAAPPIPCSCSG
jgi:hypothetical protein